MTLLKRLSLSFGVLVLLIAFNGILAGLGIFRLGETTRNLYEHPYLVSTAVLRADGNFARMESILKDVVYAQGGAIVDTGSASLAGLGKQLGVDMDIVTAQFLGPKEMVQAIRTAYADWKPASEQVLALKRAGKDQEAQEALKALSTNKGKQVESHIETLRLWSADKAKAFYENGKEQASTTLTLAFVICLVAGLIALVAAISTVRNVGGLLGGDPSVAVGHLAQIATGNLAQPIVTAYPKSLLGQLEVTRVQLRQVFQTLMESAMQLASSSEVLVVSSQQLASSAHQGSDAASGMASSIEQMSVSIAHVSNSADDAASKTLATGEVANAGSAQVLNLAGTMSSISAQVQDSSVKIADLGRQSNEIRSIVGVIKEIADQTNLLALNAAIEAARAGESGRGFAVVADEVRKLAERTAQSTKEIAGKIEAIQGNVSAAVTMMNQSVSEVVQGEGLAKQAAEAINSIKIATADVVGVVKDISNSIRENSTSSHEVAHSVETMAQLTEENSAAANQVAQTAQHLSQLAGQLNAISRRFQV